MATRVYPCTKNIAVLEKLAGVPQGTAQAFDQYKASLNQMSDEDLVKLADFSPDEFRHYGRSGAICSAIMRCDNPDFDLWSDFDIYGWGRIQYPHFLPSDVNPVSGGLTPDRVNDIEELLILQDVQLPEDVQISDLEGVWWS